MENNYLTFILYCIFYYALHSWMASNWLKEKIGFSQQRYRLLFNVVAVSTLIPGVLIFSTLERPVLFNHPGLVYYIGIISSIMGLVIVNISLMNYNLLEFTGLAAEKGNPELQVSGLNKYVRHPLYVGVFLIVWGMFVAYSTTSILIIAAVTTIYIFVGTKLEEKKLIKLFGNDYLNYKQKVPMFFPLKF